MKDAEYHRLGWRDWLVVLATPLMLIDWVPLLASSVRFEVSDLMEVLMTCLLPILILRSRASSAVHVVFGLLIFWCAVILLAVTLHGTEGTDIVRKQLGSAFSAWALALCIADSKIGIGRVALFGGATFLLMLEWSALRSGVSMFGGIVTFFSSLNRSELVYHVMRPTLNAFAPPGEPIYPASALNTVANSLVLFGCLGASAQKSDAPWARRGTWMLSAFLLLVAFGIFSSSATIVIFTLAAGALVTLFKRLSCAGSSIAALAISACLIVTAVPMYNFVKLNILEDADSRGARTDQYVRAIKVINDHVVVGAGYFEVDRNPIHNWLLFSWATAGIVAFMIATIFYFLVLRLVVQLIQAEPRNAAMAVALFMLLLVRTSAGGGGGVPSGVASVAAAFLVGIGVRSRRVVPLARASQDGSAFYAAHSDLRPQP